MVATEGTFEVPEILETRVRDMIKFAADKCYVDSPDGEYANSARALSQEDEKLTYDPQELIALRGVASLVLTRPEVAQALEREDDHGGSLAIALTAMTTQFDQAEMARTQLQFRPDKLDEGTRKLSEIGIAAIVILSLTAPKATE